MRYTPLVMTVLFLLAGASVASAQVRPQKCLHDQLETGANRARREKALEMADAINHAQGVARRFGTRGQGPFLPLDQLVTVPEAPEGFRVQLHTDGMSYSFSIKDTRDPCLYAVFSDQSLDVYEAIPSPPRVRTKLLTKK